MSRRIPLADDSRPRAPRSGCRCRNHRGKPKIQHRTREDAIASIARSHINRGGGYEIYPCPTSDRFHVRTIR